MADSSYEKGLTELSKMKVADLKLELKQRGLPTSGNKNELVERLQLALHGDSTLSLDETAEEILDEEILGDEEIEELASKTDSQESSEKRKLSTDSNGASNAKKIILNRKSVIEDIKIDNKPEETKETPKSTENAETEKKVIKLSELSMQERLEMRKRKFGMPLSESAKKLARAARFNMNNTSSSSASSIETPVPTCYELLKKREERFGSSVSSVMKKAESQAKIEKRKARFGEVKPLENVFPSKIKIVK